MASVANGGSADDIAPGVDFFKRLKDAGNLLPVDPTSATIESGQTPVVIDWDYLNAAETAKIESWKVFVPAEAAIAGYYFQAINADAPHPAAARLWEEFLYSDEGQNLWLAGGARPVRADAMVEAGTHRPGPVRRAAGGRRASPVIPTNEQTESHGRLPGGELGEGRRLSTTAPVAATSPPAPPAPTGRRFSVGPSVGLLPFLAYVSIFLIIPTITVLVGAFQDEDGGFSLEKVGKLGDELPLARPAREPAAVVHLGGGRCGAGRAAGLPRSSRLRRRA